jgi:4-hydroxy-tetrahydrodipicolinate synthase
MKNKFRGVMQSPVTPLKDDYSLDLPTFEKVLDFHVRTGAPAISWPHHKAESLNLTIASGRCSPKRRYMEFVSIINSERIPTSPASRTSSIKRCLTLKNPAKLRKSSTRGSRR